MTPVKHIEPTSYLSLSWVMNGQLFWARDKGQVAELVFIYIVAQVILTMAKHRVILLDKGHDARMSIGTKELSV